MKKGGHPLDSGPAFFDQDLQRMARLYKALANPARLSILRYLSETRTCITGDIASRVPLSRTTVTQHLKELKDVGLIKGTVDGAKTNYCLNQEAVGRHKGIIDQFFNQMKAGEAPCDPEDRGKTRAHPSNSPKGEDRANPLPFRGRGRAPGNDARRRGDEEAKK